MVPGRRWRPAFCVALFLAVLSSGSITTAAEADCGVQLVQGWHTGAGTATITMKNTGKPCGGALYTLPQTKVAVDKITVISPPKNGVVALDVPKFGYTPNPGFLGDDRFELSAEGPGGPKAGRITLRGTVFVRVEP